MVDRTVCQYVLAPYMLLLLPAVLPAVLPLLCSCWIPAARRRRPRPAGSGCPLPNGSVTRSSTSNLVCGGAAADPDDAHAALAVDPANPGPKNSRAPSDSSQEGKVNDRNQQQQRRTVLPLKQRAGWAAHFCGHQHGALRQALLCLCL
eukprot:COSAG01_NODE_1218_length_11190_cov_3.642954_4_plen_148_part_00